MAEPGEVAKFRRMKDMLEQTRLLFAESLWPSIPEREQEELKNEFDRAWLALNNIGLRLGQESIIRYGKQKDEAVGAILPGLEQLFPEGWQKV